MTQKKRIISLLMAVCMIIMLAACAPAAPAPAPTTPTTPGTPAPAPTTPAKTYTFSMGSAYDSQAPVCLAAVDYNKYVNEATNGAVTINFFPNSAIGTEKEQMIAVAADELEFTVGGMLSLDMYALDYGFFSSPYLYTGWDHLKAVMDSDLGKEMKQKSTDNNLTPMALCWRGIRETSSNIKFEKPSELPGIKIRMTELPTWVALWGAEGLGATTIPIVLGELYSALQTGVVDASEGPYEQLATYKFNEVQKFLINTNHVYEWCALYGSEKLLVSLPDDIEKILRDGAIEYITDKGSQLSADKAQGFRQQLLDGGMTEVNPDMAPFIEKLEPVHKKFFETQWTAATYDEVMAFAK